MLLVKDYEFWFITGSQHLYGEETLKQVTEHSKIIANTLDKSCVIPCKVVFKNVVKTIEEITQIIKEANYDDKCAGIITFMHTFSPSKMWINGFTLLQKPYCHFHTQFNRGIPDKEINMDFMNLNQSAHGDREHGFIGTRMRMKRKIVVGYWKDEDIQKKIGSWMRSAVGVAESKKLKIMRFGDNMRNVAVTEGDKIEVQKQLGWQVNTWPVGQLVDVMSKITNSEVNNLITEYKSNYDFNFDEQNSMETLKYQAREEIAIKKMLDIEGCKAFSNTFEDLWGMKQLPGIASQHLMSQGYGYGGEGDWKVSALTYIMKKMTEDMSGGTSFMEDYTYDLTKGDELSLGAHMLEVCPSIAANRPKIEIHHLGIGGKEAPARLVFEGKAGKGIVTSLIDMGGRLRLICQDIEAVKPIYEMPNLPVARIMWKPMPDLLTGAEAWILAGGAHHTVLSFDVTAEQLRDYARIMNIEFVHINNNTKLEDLENILFALDVAWKLK